MHDTLNQTEVSTYSTVALSRIMHPSLLLLCESRSTTSAFHMKTMHNEGEHRDR